MDTILDMNLPEYLQKSVLHEYFTDQLAVVDIDNPLAGPEEKEERVPMRLKASGYRRELSAT